MSDQQTEVRWTMIEISMTQERSKNLTIEPYIFENSKNEKVQAEFGRLKVPENRERSNGKMIELAFVRFKSTSKNPGSPIIYLVGGPGLSGIEIAKYDCFELFMALRKFGDVIALDQRGTGQSKPNLDCSSHLNLPLDKPLTREMFINEESEKLKSCAEKFEKKGVDISAYNTVENADDVNDLRQALGAEKLTLWGISYGTHLSLATIRRHGKHIDRVILAGVEGMDDTFKLPENTQKILKEIDRRIKKDSELNKEIPDLLGSIKTVLDRLEQKPVTVEIVDPNTKEKLNVTIGKYDVQLIIGGYFGSEEFLSTLPGLLKSMENGDFSYIAEQTLLLRRGESSSLMSVAMDCASGISDRRLAQIKREKDKSLLANSNVDPFPEICNSINYKELGKEFRNPVKSDVPTLFISGTFDGQTPVSNAELVKKGFKNSSHLIIEGAGHGDALFFPRPKLKKQY